MSKKLYRPFWSYDVEKTEKWLQSMAKQGYKLVGLNRITRCFSFEKAEPKQCEYRIVYNQNKGHTLSRTLVNDGWTEAAQSGNWLIVRNSVTEQKSYPARDGIIQRNNHVWKIYQYLLFILLVPIVINAIMLVPMSGESEIVPSPYWSFTILVALAVVSLIIISIYSLVKINRTNKGLGNYFEMVEQPLRYDGKLIAKRKLGWIYAPDLLEKWLEEMEAKGFHLVKVSTFGTTFYFVKGRARTVTYCVDYQKMTDGTYFNLHSEAGWKKVYTSIGPIQKWTIWSQIVEGDEERPLIYDDADHLLQYAKRIMITQVSFCIFLIVIYLFNLSLNIDMLVMGFSGNMLIVILGSLVTMLILMFSIGFFIFLAVRTCLFYKRTKEKAYR